MRKIEIHMPEYGQIRIYDADHLPHIPGLFDASTLEACSTECLAEIKRRVEETRRAKNMTREEQRESLRKAADQARGYKLYRENDRDSLALEEQPEGTTTVATDRSDAALNPHSDSLFRNPATEREYTKKELYALAGGTDIQRKIFRKMIGTDLARTNRILGAGN